MLLLVGNSTSKFFYGLSVASIVLSFDQSQPFSSYNRFYDLHGQVTRYVNYSCMFQPFSCKMHVNLQHIVYIWRQIMFHILMLLHVSMYSSLWRGAGMMSFRTIDHNNKISFISQNKTVCGIISRYFVKVPQKQVKNDNHLIKTGEEKFEM